MLKPYELTGAIQLYEVTGDEDAKRFVLTSMEKAVADNGAITEALPAQDALAYFFALKETGDGRYRIAMRNVVSQEEISLFALPFVTAYDTAYEKKGHYNEIAARFRNASDLTGDGLVALIETISVMSEEIYEYYRELCDLFKQTVGSMMHTFPSSPDPVKLCYCILRAANTGVLNREKYGDFAEMMWKTIGEPHPSSGAGLGAMLKAQRTIWKNKEV